LYFIYNKEFIKINKKDSILYANDDMDS
jgi:hypothetical protein